MFRNFNLVLRQDDSTFVRHPEEVLPDRSVQPLDISHIYQGYVEGMVLLFSVIMLCVFVVFICWPEPFLSFAHSLKALKEHRRTKLSNNNKSKE